MRRLSCFLLLFFLWGSGCKKNVSVKESAPPKRLAQKPASAPTKRETTPKKSTSKPTKRKIAKKKPAAPPVKKAKRLKPVVNRIGLRELQLRRFPRFYRRWIKKKIRTFRTPCADLDRTCMLDRIQRAARRAAPYFYHVKWLLKKEGVPEFFAYLPFAESMWKNFALSPSGAYGLTQFMDNTAKFEELKLIGRKLHYYLPRVSYKYTGHPTKPFRKVVSVYRHGWKYIYDERRDTFGAVRAMARYLKKLHRSAGRSWIFATFAYNWGPGNVGKVMRRYSRRYRGRRLLYRFLRYTGRNVGENYNYFANIWAMASIVKSMEKRLKDKFVPQRFAEVIYQPPKWRTKIVRLRNGDNPTRIARRYGLSLSKLLEQNNLTTAQCSRLSIGHRFRVDVYPNLRVTPQQIRMHLGMSIKQFYSLNKGILPPWIEIKRFHYSYQFDYKVKKGETLKKIAKKFKHLQVSYWRLRRSYRRLRLKKGAWLKIPARMSIDNTRGYTNRSGYVENMARMLKKEKIMPPLPNGWRIYVPIHLKPRLKAFLKKVYEDI